jgi:hypothetical protein
MEIADARVPGRSHFYFLPPMAAKPAYAGDFDASVLPHVAVEVCEFSPSAADGCGQRVARFTAEGRKLDRVWTSQYFEHYLAVWRTDGPEVSPDKTYRVVVLAARTALGHADVKVVRTLAEAGSVDRAQYAVAFKWLPLFIRFRIETGGVFLVGDAGGIVTAGAVRLEFPAGAVSGVIGVTVAAATGLPPDARAPIAGTAFDFGPDGAQFAKPVNLSISYDQAAVPADVDEGSLRLHKLTDGAWIEVVGSAVEVDANTVTGEITSFSKYSVLPARPDPGALGHIAFVRTDDQVIGDIFLMDADGSNVTNLTKHGADYRDLAWAPAGDKLAFVTNRDGNEEVYVMGPAGELLRNVSSGSGADHSPNWAPAASLGDLFFTGRATCPGGGDYQGILAGRSGGGAAQELAPPAIQMSGPDQCGHHGVRGGPGVSIDGAHVAYNWSIGPDGAVFLVSSAVTGKAVAFFRIASWLDPIVVDFPTVSADGGTSTAGYRLRAFAWSPKDANTIAVAISHFSGDVDGVYLADLRTGSASRVVDNQFSISELAWSPTGDKIAFRACRRDRPCEDQVYVVDLSTGAIADVTRTSNFSYRSFTWSPAGDRIAFSGSPFPFVRDHIYVVSLAQPGGLTQLTNSASGSDDIPRWRP